MISNNIQHKCIFCGKSVRYSSTHQRGNHLKCLTKYEDEIKKKEMEEFVKWLKEKINASVENI